MNTNAPLDHEESFALDAYGALPRSQPPAALDARILAAAHAANARVARSPRRWTTGLATAAVAVLAVGIAWRGMDSRQTDLPVSREPAAPRMQPAFKAESETPAFSARDADAAGKVEREAAAAAASAIVPAAAPELSSADWESTDSTSEEKRNPAANAPSPRARARDAADDSREPGRLDAPSPSPASPPQPVSGRDTEETVTQAVPPEPAIEESAAPMAEAAPQLDEQAPPPARARPEPAPPPPPSETAGNAGARQELRRLGTTRKDSGSAAVGAAAAAPAGEEGARAQATFGTSGAVTAQGIHAGTTSLTHAVAAARGALARGDRNETRRLAMAIVARFGRTSLPEDLRNYAQP